MFEFLSWLEGSPLGQAIRGANVWTYGILNLVHILGIGTLFGSVLVLDLRLMGVWHSIPLTAITRPTVPLAASGFVIAVLSGISMLTVNATEYYGNPFLFYVKFPALALALLNIAVLQCLPAWRARNRRALLPAERFQLAVSGGVSLVCWLTVVAGGRLIGYW